LVTDPVEAGIAIACTRSRTVSRARCLGALFYCITFSQSIMYWKSMFKVWLDMMYEIGKSFSVADVY